jgi:hypothetical protein
MRRLRIIPFVALSLALFTAAALAEAPPSVWARYALIRKGVAVEHLVIVRTGDRVEHRYVERGETDLWRRDARGELEHLKLYPRAGRAVHFTPGDLRTISLAPSWDGLSALVSAAERAGLVAQGKTRALGGRAATVLSGRLRGQPARLTWVPELGLPAALTVGRGDARVALRLVAVDACSGERCTEASRSALRVLEFADLGDMEHDPFARSFLHPSH